MSGSKFESFAENGLYISKGEKPYQYLVSFGGEMIGSFKLLPKRTTYDPWNSASVPALPRLEEAAGILKARLGK
jgi:hypothetical protein